MPAIFPDTMAPIVRVAVDGERQIEMMRWGTPGPPQYGGRLRRKFRTIPAMAAEVESRLWSLEELVEQTSK